MKHFSLTVFLTVFIILLTACNNVNKPVNNGGSESSFLQHSSEYNDLLSNSNNSGSDINSLQSAIDNSSDALSVPDDHTHEFTAATCAIPKTCSICGLTEGEPLGHRWVAANCMYPKYCLTCKETDNKLGEHIYNNGICNVCGSYDPDINYVAFNSADWVANMVNRGTLHQFTISYSDQKHYISYSKYEVSSYDAAGGSKLTYSHDGANYIKIDTSEKIEIGVEEVHNTIYITDDKDNRLVLERFTEDVVKITEMGKKCFGYEKLLRVGMDFKAESAE